MTALFIGTVTFAVVDDLKGRGASWRALKVAEDALYYSIGEFLQCVADYLGYRTSITCIGAESTASSVMRIESLLKGIFDERASITEHAQLLLWPDGREMPTSVPALLVHWDELISGLQQREVWVELDRAALA